MASKPNSRSKNQTRQHNPHKPNFWGMMRDVLLQSINKGVFPFACIFFIFLILVIKLESADALKLLNIVINALANFSILGWTLFGLSAAGWFVHAKTMRRIHTTEMIRVSSEKKQLQEQVVNKKLPSSN